MAITAPVVDGKITDLTASSESLSSTTKSSNSTLDKDAFLQLLVAQMKYQDPLEPTSNTEYISQFATFSELEEMQNMSSAMDLSRASGLVGQQVIMKVTSESTGETTYEDGKVDYVVYENGKAYLSIGGSLYSLDDLDTVADKDYLDAYALATEFATAINALPTVGNLTSSYADGLANLREVYDDMTAYQKTFIASDLYKKFQEYETKMTDLLKTDASNFTAAISALPAVDELTTDYEQKLKDLRTEYDKMPTTLKTAIGDDTLNKLKEYETKMAELLGTTTA
ncbi:MAG: flagellar hook capping FlgD N-terminal domain-containing protein [bacterium]|nr:flagellar hook capping FlgD N-terminal domain-containing protein [bacterium]